MLYLIMIEIGQAVYRCRLERGLTQAALARQAGIRQANLSNIEKGKRDLTVSTLRRLAAALAVPAGSFFEAPPAHGTRRTRRFTRAWIEKIARAAVRSKGIRLTEDEAAAAQALGEIVPGAHKRYGRVRKSHKAWIYLRSRFSAQEIRDLVARIRDVLMRMK